MPLFEVAVLEMPTKKEAEENGAVERLVLAPTAVVAQDPQSAAIAAVSGKADMRFDPSRQKVLVRPFA